MKISSSHIIPFIKLFSNTKIMDFATKVGFMKRKRSILPDTIVKVFIFGLAGMDNPSLNQIADKCEEFQPGLSISKVGIFKKLKVTSSLLQNIFYEILKITAQKAIKVKTANVLSNFTDVKICDSTKISLPDKLADLWPGLGGRNAKASLKIQGVYSLTSSCFSSIEITKSPGSDTAYLSKLLNLINKGELLITDLGYFSKDFFMKLMEKEAFFLTRIKTNTVIYQNKDSEMTHFNLAEFVAGKNNIDEEVYVGVSYQKQLKCRLVATRLPDNVINERRRKANKSAKYQGKQLTKNETEILAYNLIITNVEKDILPAEAVLDLYRARWQIELVFKACKSYIKLDKIGQCGRDQLECLIYGRLITVAIAFLFYNMLYLSVYDTYKKWLSMLLFIKLLSDNYKTIGVNLKLNANSINLISKILQKISKRSLHEKRKEKTTFEILQGYSFS